MAEQLKTEALDTQNIAKNSENNKKSVDYTKQKDLRKNIEGQEKISLTVETTKGKINTIVNETKGDVNNILPKKVGKTKTLLLA